MDMRYCFVLVTVCRLPVNSNLYYDRQYISYFVAIKGTFWY